MTTRTTAKSPTYVCQTCGSRGTAADGHFEKEGYDRLAGHGGNVYEHRSCYKQRIEAGRAAYLAERAERIARERAAEAQATAEGHEPDSLAHALRAAQIYRGQ